MADFDIAKPIKSVEEKWKLLPHFLRLRGLMRQHIDSYNHLINVDIKQIVAAKSNRELRSEADPKFFLQYTDIYVGEPNLEEESFVSSQGIELVVIPPSTIFTSFSYTIYVSPSRLHIFGADIC